MQVLHLTQKKGISRAEFAKILCTVLDINTDDYKGMEEPFNDVKTSDWHHKYIVALYNYRADDLVKDWNGAEITGKKIGKGNIINGKTLDTFDPDANITREEAAKMLAAAYELKIDKALSAEHTQADNDNNFGLYDLNLDVDGKIESTKEINKKDIDRDVTTKFEDDKDIATWADESVAVLSGKAYLNELDILRGNHKGEFKHKSDITRAEALVIVQRAAATK